MANYWLLKSEPGCYSIDDLKKDKKTLWTGIRNYQARNFLRDSIKVGDFALFYHSGANPPGVAGVAKVTGPAQPDPTAFDKKDEHFDPKSIKSNPMWYGVEITFQNTFKKFVSLDQIKFEPTLKGIVVAQRGSRLSVQLVSKPHFDEIVKMGE